MRTTHARTYCVFAGPLKMHDTSQSQQLLEISHRDQRSLRYRNGKQVERYGQTDRKGPGFLPAAEAYKTLPLLPNVPVTFSERCPCCAYEQFNQGLGVSWTLPRQYCPQQQPRHEILVLRPPRYPRSSMASASNATTSHLAFHRLARW